MRSVNVIHAWEFGPNAFEGYVNDLYPEYRELFKPFLSDGAAKVFFVSNTPYGTVFFRDSDCISTSPDPNDEEGLISIYDGVYILNDKFVKIRIKFFLEV